jgi:hypothetical protein
MILPTGAPKDSDNAKIPNLLAASDLHQNLRLETFLEMTTFVKATYGIR